MTKQNLKNSWLLKTLFASLFAVALYSAYLFKKSETQVTTQTLEFTPQPFEKIEHIKTLLQKLLSFESSGTNLPPELLNAYFSDRFQEKYKNLSQKTFDASKGSQHSEVKKLSKISENQWQAWIEISQKDQPSSTLAFRLNFLGNKIDLLTLETNTSTSVPVVSGSEVIMIHLFCPWNQMKLSTAPQWLKQIKENEFLIGYEKSRLIKNSLQIPCGNKTFQADIDEGSAYLDETLLDLKVLAHKKATPSDLEKKLQETLGFTVE